MSKYAVIKIGSFQYKVEEGKEYEVPKFQAEEGKKFSDAEVLAFADGEKAEFGMPTVKGIKVDLSIIEQGKGEKVITRKYKSKSRYRKARGFRKQVTRFKVDKISKTK